MNREDIRRLVGSLTDEEIEIFRSELSIFGETFKKRGWDSAMSLLTAQLGADGVKDLLADATRAVEHYTNNPPSGGYIGVCVPDEDPSEHKTPLYYEMARLWTSLACDILVIGQHNVNQLLNEADQEDLRNGVRKSWQSWVGTRTNTSFAGYEKCNYKVIYGPRAESVAYYVDFEPALAFARKAKAGHSHYKPEPGYSVSLIGREGLTFEEDLAWRTGSPFVP